MKHILVFLFIACPLEAVAQQETCNLDSPPEPCRGMECKDACAAEGDPVHTGTGFTFHIAKDIELSTGFDTLKLHRYYVPTSDVSFKKSSARFFLDFSTFTSWPTGIGTGPFGSRVVGSEPEWTHDFFSFVAQGSYPPPELRPDGGAAVPYALVYQGTHGRAQFARTASSGLLARGARAPGEVERLEILPSGYRLIQSNGEQWLYRKLLGTTATNGPVFLSEVRRSDGLLRFSMEYVATGCMQPSQASAVVLPSGARLEFNYTTVDGQCVMRAINWRPPGSATTSPLAAYSYAQAGRLSTGGDVIDGEAYNYGSDGDLFAFTQGSDGGGRLQAEHRYLKLPFLLSDGGFFLADGGFNTVPVAVEAYVSAAESSFAVSTSLPTIIENPSFLQCTLIHDTANEFGEPEYSVSRITIWPRTTTVTPPRWAPRPPASSRSPLHMCLTIPTTSERRTRRSRARKLTVVRPLAHRVPSSSRVRP